MAEAIRPPSGDWLGTPFLRFERRGPFGYCIIDRPAKRNAMTGAMYFGIRYAIDHVDRDPDLAGLLLTGTGDVFAPGGDLSGDNEDGWADLPNLLGMENTPFDALRQSVKPVVSAVNGICQGGGLIIAMLSDMAVVSDRAVFRAPELYRGIADTHYAQILARQIGPARARDLLFTGRRLSAVEAEQWGLVEPRRVSRPTARGGRGGACTMLQDGATRAFPAEAHVRPVLRPVRPHRHESQPFR